LTVSSSAPPGANLDRATVDGFGREWDAFDQTGMDDAEHARRFDDYFHIFPFESLPADAEGFDLGCGSSRWAAGVVQRPEVGTLHCIDPAPLALDVARRRLASDSKARFHLAGASSIPLADDSQDFGYSIGVLHHIPDTETGLRDCVKKLKPGAPFLTYLYYDFENKPGWFRAVWKASDLMRRGISRLPFGARKAVTGLLAATIYWPVTRIALAAEKAGRDVHAFPLAPYRHWSFYTMRTDALDRFGTQLERRFSRADVQAMMERSGLEDIRFSTRVPFWTAYGRKRG